MKLVGAGGQAAPHFTYDASGSIVSGTAPQLLLPRRMACSALWVANLSATYAMYLDLGSARAVATITGGAVTAVTVTNPGFGFAMPPIVQFRGGGNAEYTGFLGATEPGAPPPRRPARAHAVMTGAAPAMTVSAIVIEDPGSGYLLPPYVAIANHSADANGCADPSYGGGSGLLLPVNGGSFVINGTVCPTDPIAIYAAGGAGARFTCKWMD